jgi:K+-sensing histidine kinase KdpD
MGARTRFRVSNLEALRELALREVAESIGRAQGPAGAAQNEALRATGDA